MTRIIYILCFIFCTSCGNNKTYNGRLKSSFVKNQKSKIRFEGIWNYCNSDTTNSFQIEIKQFGDSIYGKYCSVYQSGRRIDCDEDSIYNIYGISYDDSAFILFNSFFGGKNGQAELIEIDTNTLRWQVVKLPIDGDCYVPAKVVMHRR